MLKHWEKIGKNFLTNQKIQKGLSAKSYLTLSKGFIIYDERETWELKELS
jgi:hypothetical protein